MSDINKEEVRVVFDPKEPITVRLTTDAADEMEIDLVKAGRVLLTHWKQVAVITLVFVLLGAGVAWWRYEPVDESAAGIAAAKVDLYEGVEIQANADYDILLNNAQEYYTDLLRYLDALNTYLVAVKNYDTKAADINTLSELRQDSVAAYDDSFGRAASIHALYGLVQDSDVEKKLLDLELRQKFLTREITYLEQEVAFLRSLAGTGTDEENPLSVDITAQGMEKIRAILTYRDEYEDNQLLIAQLQGTADNGERLQQTGYADELIAEGLTAFEENSRKLNQLVGKLTATPGLNLTAERLADAANPTAAPVYTVTVSAPQPVQASSANTLIIVIIMAMIGFGLACVWVVWRYYRKEAMADVTL